jgi:hypothetical protein
VLGVVSPALTQRLEELIAEYSGSTVAWERSLASRFGAVPLHADEVGCVLLSPAGEWLFVYAGQDWAATVEYSRDVSDDYKELALRTAVARHPELLALMRG